MKIIEKDVINWLFVFCEKAYPFCRDFIADFLVNTSRKGDIKVEVKNKRNLQKRSGVCVDTRVGEFHWIWQFTTVFCLLFALAVLGVWVVEKFVHSVVVQVILVVPLVMLVGIGLIICVLNFDHFKGNKHCFPFWCGMVMGAFCTCACVCYFAEIFDIFTKFSFDELRLIAFGVTVWCFSFYAIFAKIEYIDDSGAWAATENIEFVGFKNAKNCNEGFVMDDLRSVHACLDKSIVVTRVGELIRTYRLLPIEDEKQKIVSRYTVYVWDEHKCNWVEESK